MDCKQRVESLLKNYNEIQRHLDRLNFEIERFSGLDYEQVIETMNYAAPEEERVQSSSISDKSGRLALSYKEYTNKLNADVVALALEYYTQKDELDVLDYCINLLDPKLSEIITDMFVNKMTWDEMSYKYHVSRTMLSKYRKKGINSIASLFQLKRVS